MRTTSHQRILLGALLSLVAGCASLNPVPTPEDQKVSSRDFLATDELRAVEGLTAFEAIRRLQPRWLAGRGPSSLGNAEAESLKVYLDGMFYGDAAILRRMSVRTIEEIRYLDARRATTRFGIGHTQGALLVSTRQGFVARR